MFGSPLRRTVSMYLIVFVSFKLAVDVSKCITHIKLDKNQVQNEPYFIGYWVKVSREVHFYFEFGKKYIIKQKIILVCLFWQKI